jgi:C4-dicarboxylate-specific signal transduction histidine kinase
MLMNSRVIAWAVSHEVRNLSAAASVLFSQLGKSVDVREREEFAALGKVLSALKQLSTSELPAASEALEGVNMSELMHQLRMIVSPEFEDSGVRLEWEVAENLPFVRANSSGLIQVFINLARNAERAAAESSGGVVRVTVYQLGEAVVVRFSDNGSGVAVPDHLFQPFKSGSSSSGLGLYVSRAILRTFGGELKHERRGLETCFVVELPAADVPSRQHAHA